MPNVGRPVFRKLVPSLRLRQDEMLAAASKSIGGRLSALVPMRSGPGHYDEVASPLLVSDINADSWCPSGLGSSSSCW